jgi:hypothetical protein
MNISIYLKLENILPVDALVLLPEKYQNIYGIALVFIMVSALKVVHI